MDDSQVEKVCSSCKKKKPLTGFYRHCDRPDGRRARCKECSRRDKLKKRKMIDIETTRVCLSCEMRKPIKEFAKNTGARNGRNASCKRCLNTKRSSVWTEYAHDMRRMRRKGVSEKVWGNE